jgi:hypothetical protein
MKQLFSFLLTISILLLAACAAPAETTPERTTPVPTTPAATTPVPTPPAYDEVENPISFLTVSLHEAADDPRSIMAYLTESGTVYVEYIGDVTKVGELPANAIHGITAAFESCDLARLNGQDVYGSGEAVASLYVVLADGTCYTAGYSGSIPAAYQEGYRALDIFFAALTAHLPVYVPKPIPLNEVEEKYLNELSAILSGGGIADQDAFTVTSGLSARELGLSDSSKIASSAYCAPLMMTTPYCLTIVTLKEGADADDVCRDFKENLNWGKFVCVQFDKALIAVKDDMVLCLMAAGTLYTKTAAGIEATGWDIVSTAKP